MNIDTVVCETPDYVTLSYIMVSLVYSSVSMHHKYLYKYINHNKTKLIFFSWKTKLFPAILKDFEYKILILSFLMFKKPLAVNYFKQLWYGEIMSLNLSITR